MSTPRDDHGRDAKSPTNHRQITAWQSTERGTAATLLAPAEQECAYEAAHELSMCVDFARAIDPATGRQRFDMTPPPDLPPPPSNLRDKTR